jgi:hypothetical protein
MKRYVLALMAAFPVVAVGGSGGIEEGNSLVSVTGMDSTMGNSFLLSGEARFPVSAYTGMWIDAGISAFSGKNAFVDSTTKQAGVGVLARKYELGILQASFTHGELEYDLNPGTDKSKFNVYSLGGSYYFDRVDASLSFTTIDPDVGDTVRGSTIGASYYVTDNTSVGAAHHRMDSNDSYSLHLAHQPAMFHNDVRVGLDYQTDNDVDSYYFSISYFFGTKVSLIDRVRRF